MKKIYKYIIALTNLYGIVDKDLVVRIFNSQNNEKVSVSEIEHLLNRLPKELTEKFVFMHKDFFVHEAVLITDDFDLLLQQKADKPYYVPDKKELLKYVDDWYFEKNLQYKALLEYVKKNFISDDFELAEAFCENIYRECQVGADVQTLIDCFNDENISFEDMDQANEVMQLVMGLFNNVRIWENNGYTPNEISEKCKKTHMGPFPDHGFEYSSGNDPVDKKEKTGRNSPCPCGSGKKYKKCCYLKNSES